LLLEKNYINVMGAHKIDRA